MNSKISLEEKNVKGLLSVVIPCFKSPRTLEELVEEISAKVFGIWETEILLICDSSPDQTWDRILEIAKHNNRVKGVLLGVNVGQHAATSIGLNLASGELAVTIDDDFININGEVRKLLKELDHNTDLVYGVSTYGSHFHLRNVITKVAKRSLVLLKMTNNKHRISSLRLMRGIIIPETSVHEVPGVEIDLVLNSRSRRTKFITVNIPRPTFKNSRYNLKSLLNYFLGLMLFTTERFARLIFLASFTFLVTSSILSLIYLTRYLAGAILVPGFTSIALLILLTSAFQLITISAIGLYIVKMSKDSKRPLEIWIREVTY